MTRPRQGSNGVDDVLDVFREWGHDHYDEAVSQLDHALQTAALAVRAGASEPLVAAALLHDVGHLLDLRDEHAEGGSAPGVGVATEHEQRGARYLAAVFPPSVTAPVALHVQAKRYRCAVDPGYADGLSEGSTRSLVVQGGPFGPEEVAAFEALPGSANAVALREWDDGGKVLGLEVAPLDSYRDLLVRVAAARP